MPYSLSLGLLTTPSANSRRTGRSRGFGFVDIREHKPNTAIEALHGVTFGGRQLTERPARKLDQS
jgi:RNA recognition motif-containing protein